jgi:hypothetical protein
MTESVKRWISRAKWAALWCIPIWLCLAVDTYYFYQMKGSPFEILTIPGIAVNMLFKGAWTGMHNFKMYNIAIYSGIVYYILVLIVLLIVDRIRRRWQAMISTTDAD